MPERSKDLGALYNELAEMIGRGSVIDPPTAESLLRGMERLKSSAYKTDLKCFETFLPPRLVQAAKERRCVPFFGAGVSVEADIPLWWDLLSRLGVEADVVKEPELEHDPLTAAEVLASRIGMPMLDNALRTALTRARTPTLAHFLLAALNQDVYVTTNYDSLFEIAWKTLYYVEPRVVTTDQDLTAEIAKGSFEKIDGRPLLFKLHGCVDRRAEELILTRSQYRRHYRSNQEIFKVVRRCLQRSNTLFVGFGHRDPEITRLVEDVIHAHETRSAADDDAPAFYSLQFNMGKRTPEIFAARGIVALQPPLALEAPEKVDPRTAALVSSQFDFLGAVDSDAHSQLDLDLPLSHCLTQLGEDLRTGLRRLEDLAGELREGGLAVADGRLRTLCDDLGEMAGQGVYLLQENDEIIDVEVPAGLTLPDRKAKDLHQRAYVKQAHMYREPFISATFESVFNGNATAFLCVPILDDKKYQGLLFSAFQVGAWETPLKLRDGLREGEWGQELSFVLLDSEGVLLLPPNAEFEPGGATVSGEDPEGNVGYEFDRLLRLSRRDKLVERVWNNIVPLSRDDDVLRLGEIEMYSVVAEVPGTRWKLALSIPTP